MGRLLLIPIRNVSLFVLLTDIFLPGWWFLLLIWIFWVLPMGSGRCLAGFVVCSGVGLLVFWSFGLSLIC